MNKRLVWNLLHAFRIIRLIPCNSPFIPPLLHFQSIIIYIKCISIQTIFLCTNYIHMLLSFQFRRTNKHLYKLYLDDAAFSVFVHSFKWLLQILILSSGYVVFLTWFWYDGHNRFAIQNKKLKTFMVGLIKNMFF